MCYFKMYIKNYKKNMMEDYIKKYLLKMNLKHINFDIDFNNILIEDKGNLEFNCYIRFCNKISIFKSSVVKEYMIICNGNIKNLDKNFRIITIKNIDNYKINLPYYLNHRFLPIISKNQTNIIANKFLSKYFSSVSNNGYIDIKKLLFEMGLSLEYKKLSVDSSIFGMISFEDTEIKYFESDIEKRMQVKMGTIFIDPIATSKYAGIYTNNFAIVHECVHWYLHRKYFVFYKEMLKYYKYKNIVPHIQKKDINWMEYQANEIASKIILPEDTLKKEIQVILECFNNKSHNNISLIEECIDNIAKKAGVSREAVKIRLLKMDLNVNGIFEYIDGKYINSYIFKRRLKKGESYSISLKDFLSLILNDDNFRKLIFTDNYIFIDNHLCIKSSKYLIQKDYKIQLTEYALNHIDECCVLFLYEIENEFNYIYNYDYILCKSPSKKQNIKIKGFETIEEIKSSPEKFDKYYDKILMIFDAIPYNFRKKMRYLRECIGMTREKLEEKSLVSAQTIKEIETNEKRGYSIETIISLCIGMNLPPELSFELIRMSGFNIENNLTKQNCLYCFILRNLYNLGIDEINDFLESNDISPLTKIK